MDHPFGDDDKTFQLGETYQYYQPITIGDDHPSICPPLLLPATTTSRWPPPVEGGADPTGSSSPHGHSTIAKDPARRSRVADKRTGGGVKLSTDPQSVAARQRRHRISDRFKILKSLVPGGSKMDTVSMLEEAINYVKFLKAQIWLHQAALMLHPEDQYRPPPPPPSFPASNAAPAAAAAASASTNVNVTGNYNYASSFTSTCCLVLPNEHQHTYTMPPGDHQQQQATTSSVACPCCTFHDEEGMFHQGTLNY